MGEQAGKQNKKTKLCVALLAHVDAGKTTLAEGMLYLCGEIKSPGRIDHGDTSLDTHFLERERGITIFSKQAGFSFGGTDFTLLDTPGHADFASEMERTLGVTDCAVLVISGTAGVQSHTETLWRLLESYNIPCFIFVSKMDLPTSDKEQVLSRLCSCFGDGCVDFSSGINHEELALKDEKLLDSFLANGKLSDGDISQAVGGRRIFPCYFGSGLKLQGISELLSALERFTPPKSYSSEFGAKIFKISRDAQGRRMSLAKITGGELNVRDSISYMAPDGGMIKEKITALRRFSGAKFAETERVAAGEVCAILGLSSSYAGQGLGVQKDAPPPSLEPALSYRISLPEGCNAQAALSKLLQLQEEDPLLGIVWNSGLGEIHARLMGDTQIEILRRIISERFDIDVQVDSGKIMYKETIAESVYGAGHFEPLRHYAEVHLLLEPLKRGSGLIFTSDCSEDLLDRNWQRLILSHLEEKQHPGVLTGSPITDMRISLAAGRAHLKHTEGGDFREATYRALRQGLMKAKSVLLEPYYAFSLEVPAAQTGRAINDIRAMNGELSCVPRGEFSLLEGKAPVSGLRGYMSEVLAYTGGRGRLTLRMAGYMPCLRQDKVVEELAYEPESDKENTGDSVFCAHGAGFNVKWNQSDEYMHLECGRRKAAAGSLPALRSCNLNIDEKELEAIMVREFGPIKRPMYRSSDVKNSTVAETAASAKKDYLIIDGYNLIFAWDALKELARVDLAMARARLVDVLASYRSFSGSRMVLVFDGYNVAGSPGEKSESHGINIVYTKHNETADMYIEKLSHDIGRNFSVRVVTSDNLIRLSAMRSGVLRVSSREFINELEWAYKQIGEILEKTRHKEHTQKIDFGGGENGT